jgi:DNA-binding transcriptional LysR family regulator
MDKIYSMRVFSRVAEVGSFTIVANQMDCAAGNISRAIASLEVELRTRLLQRTTRRILLTESGERYYARCKQILADIDHADGEARAAFDYPEGRLTVHAQPGLGHTHVTDVIIDYQSRFPNVAIKLTVGQTMPSLLEEQFDISVVTASTLPGSAYIGDVVGTSYSVLVASPRYLAMHRAPRVLGELSNHACLRLNSPGTSPKEWRLRSGNDDAVFLPPSPQFAVNDPEAMRVALRSGAGIGPLAVYSAIDDIREGALIRVLPEFRMRSRNVYVIYPSHQFVDAKTRTFLTFLKGNLGRRLGAQEKELEQRPT